MAKFLLKRSHYSLNAHFEFEKVSLDDFLMTTWMWEVKSQRKKKPQIPHPGLKLWKALFNLLYKL